MTQLLHSPAAPNLAPSSPTIASLDLIARVAVASLVTLLAACGGGGGKGPNNEVIAIPPSQSSYKAGQGERAKMETVNQVNPVGTYFDKRYNRPNLEGVLRASGTESVKYVEAIKVSPYRVANSTDLPFFVNLPLVTDDLLKVWSQASGGVSQGSLAGLYFEACGFIQCASGTGSHPTILIGQTSTRWVIVHEMMHHLFNMQRKVDNLPNNYNISQKLEKSVTKVQAMLDKFNEFNDRGYLLMAATEMDNTISLTKASLATSKLEETTVERLLVDEWAADRLRYVDPSSPKNAVWYMTTNADAALEMTTALEQSLNTIKDKATAAQAADVLAHIATNQADLAAYEDGIKKTVKDAAAIVYGRLGGNPGDPVDGNAGLVMHPLMSRDPYLDDCTGDNALFNHSKAILQALH